ncbi:MAG: uroporphyrinogen-III synthase [Beijerinckiaceae bacterium]
MKVLVVRAVEDARRTAVRLSRSGVQTIVSPVLSIRPLDSAEPDGDFHALVATSAHAFAAPFADRFRNAPLFLVGERTADSARAKGFETIAAIADSAANLIPIIRDKVPIGRRLLYLAGRDRKDELERALSATHDLAVVEAYAAEPASTLNVDAVAALRVGAVDAVLHYSRRSARIFSALVARGGLEPSVRALRHVTISQDAAAPLIEAGWRVDIAARPDEDAMIALLLASTDGAQTTTNRQEEK